MDNPPGVGSPAHRLRQRALARGPLPFADFMEEALYGRVGYYRQAELPIGEDGDFVTGSSFSPLFARATARLVRGLDAQLGIPSTGAAEYFEAAYGSGIHLAEVARSLAVSKPGAVPGAVRRIRGWDRVLRPLPADVRERVEILAELDAVGEGEIEGLLFSYELFDALPVHRLIGLEDGSVGELYAAFEPGEAEPGTWRFEAGPLSRPELAELLGGHRLEAGQVADLSPGWAPLYRRLARRLGRGLLVTCDYGFERPRLLDARIRRHGTLACYTGQKVHRNPFVRIGKQDLTAHVDFTALREAGEAEGLTTLAFTRQALWLAACGLFEELTGADAAARRSAMALLDGEGMGEEIRVLVQGRGVELEPLLPAGFPPDSLRLPGR